MCFCVVQDVQDDMADLMEDMNEIQELMGRSYGYVYAEILAIQ